MPELLSSPWIALCAVLSIDAAACASEAGSADAGGDSVVPITGLSTGATCPDDNALSYENFGRAFFEQYCLRCHSVSIGGSERLAPPGRDFDELMMIRSDALYIDQFAAAGPKGEHVSMPPNGETPTLEERTELGEWLACGAPR